MVLLLCLVQMRQFLITVYFLFDVDCALAHVVAGVEPTQVFQELVDV